MEHNIAPTIGISYGKTHNLAYGGDLIGDFLERREEFRRAQQQWKTLCLDTSGPSGEPARLPDVRVEVHRPG